jgi:hypothetical protein
VQPVSALTRIASVKSFWFPSESGPCPSTMKIRSDLKMINLSSRLASAVIGPPLGSMFRNRARENSTGSGGNTSLEKKIW